MIVGLFTLSLWLCRQFPALMGRSEGCLAPGPLLGVLIDIGLLEGLRALSSYRMIVFGGLVALLLAWRPRGLLDEATVHRFLGGKR